MKMRCFVRRCAVIHKKGVQTPWAKTRVPPDRTAQPLWTWTSRLGALPRWSLGASPVSETHDLPLLLGTPLVTSRQPQYRGDAVGPLEAMLTAALAVCSVSLVVLAVSLCCDTTHNNNSEIHNIFSGVAGRGLSTCQCCCFGDSPYVPLGKMPQLPWLWWACLGHTCPLSHHHSLWHGARVVLQWGGPYQLGSHPIPGQRPTAAGAGVHLCHTTPCFVLGGDHELWTSLGLGHIAGERSL